MKKMNNHSKKIKKEVKLVLKGKLLKKNFNKKKIPFQKMFITCKLILIILF